MASKRKAGDTDAIHARRVQYIRGAHTPSDVEHKLDAFFGTTATELMKILDALEPGQRDEGRITAALDTLTHALLIAKQAVALPGMYT